MGFFAKHSYREFHSKNWQEACLQTCLFLLALVMLFALPCRAQDKYDLAVDSDFLRQLDPPGDGNHLVRPENVFVDRRAGEVFVTDPGNGRVVAFDTTGMYLFEFGGKDAFGNVGDVVVDSHGFIYVLGSTQNGRHIFKFDYDGLLIGELQLTGLPDDLELTPFTMNISDSDLIYVVNGSNPEIAVFDTEGKFQSRFAVLGDLTEKLRREAILGQPEIDSDRIYLPAPMVGAVYVYDLDGNLKLTFGIQGNLIGELNFPIDVTIIDHRIAAVLDKHRFAVVCFSTNGQFLGEFGGMGVAPGRFYHPAYIDHDGQQRLYISQRFMNRVQVCILPKLITDRLDSLGGASDDGSLSESVGEPDHSSLESRLPQIQPEEVVRKTSSTPVSLSSFLFVSNSRRLN